MEVKELEVTAEDIEFGIPGKAENCPISRCAKRAFQNDHATFCDDEGEWVLTVGDQRFEVVDGDDFARAFDAKKPVTPGFFDLVELGNRVDEDDEHCDD